jgi:hypothetical protein
MRMSGLSKAAGRRAERARKGFDHNRATDGRTALAIAAGKTLQPGEQVEVGYPDGSIVVVICDEAGRLRVRAMPVEGNSGETLAERQSSAIVKGVTEG